MLEVKEANLQVKNSGKTIQILSNVCVDYPTSHFGAIIGPSGCGKTSFLKLVAGIAPGVEEGNLFWKKQNLDKQDFNASELAYVPQFSIAHEELTAWENVRYSLSLRVKSKDTDNPKQIVDSLLREVGLSEFGNQKAKTLSGGQRRRLALAMELTSCPEILLCDEVTSGLDPQSEDEVVKLLQHQAKTEGRLVLSVTHSLEHLELYDSILVLCRGFVVYHGPPSYLLHHFQLQDAAQLYSRLSEADPEYWADAWLKNKDEVLKMAPTANEAVPNENGPQERKKEIIPGPVSQCATLLKRRIVIFFRSFSQIFLQIGLILGFPLLVTVFAWKGLPSVNTMSLGLSQNAQKQFDELLTYLDH
ncbi:MAG: ABC transporter ATP-binding protein, partial [Verrucomicrobiales bacterium]|nr:ABC transporter ATP-binding protein [Verrucomicrobiales bacterium]